LIQRNFIMKRQSAMFTLVLIMTSSSLLPAPTQAIEAAKAQPLTSSVHNQASVYSNAEVRSILNGLGFTEAPEVGADYPFTSYNGALSDRVTIEAISPKSSEAAVSRHGGARAIIL
jgi:hypothetical protein